MGDVVNLRIHRKRKARGEREALAAENRARFGRSKADKAQDAALAELAERRLDGHRRETDPKESP